VKTRVKWFHLSNIFVAKTSKATEKFDNMCITVYSIVLYKWKT